MGSQIVDTYSTIEPQCPLCKQTLKQAVTSKRQDEGNELSEPIERLGEVVLEQNLRIKELEKLLDQAN